MKEMFLKNKIKFLGVGIIISLCLMVFVYKQDTINHFEKKYGSTSEFKAIKTLYAKMSSFEKNYANAPEPTDYQGSNWESTKVQSSKEYIQTTKIISTHLGTSSDSVGQWKADGPLSAQTANLLLRDPGSSSCSYQQTVHASRLENICTYEVAPLPYTNKQHGFPNVNDFDISILHFGQQCLVISNCSP
jgi:hypothetical protein